MGMVVVDFVFYEKLQNGKKSIGKVKSASTFTFSLQKLYVNQWYVFTPLRIHWGRHGVMEKVPKGLETFNDQLGCKKSKSVVSFSFFFVLLTIFWFKKKRINIKGKKGRGDDERSRGDSLGVSGLSMMVPGLRVWGSLRVLGSLSMGQGSPMRDPGHLWVDRGHPW